MNKKILVIMLVLLLAVSSVFATTVSTKLVDNSRNNRFNSTKMTNEKLGLGLSIGYPGLGLALNYTKNDLNKNFGFRYYLDAGFGYSTSFVLNTGFDWVFVKLIFTDTDSKEAENSILDFSIGAGAHLYVGGDGSVGLGPIGTLAITYNFARDWQVFWRPSFGWGWWLAGPNAAGSGFIWDVRAGFTYQFDLARNK